MWLMAQSNVAVKNIAEKLAETNFLDFKILVSLDFHFQWWVDPIGFILASCSYHIGFVQARTSVLENRAQLDPE